MVIEKCCIQEADGRHPKLAAKWCCPLPNGCIAVVESHEDRPWRKIPTLGVSQNILQADRSVVSGEKSQRNHKVGRSGAHTHSLGKWRLLSCDVMKDHAPQRVRGTEQAGNSETARQAPECSSSYTQRHKRFGISAVKVDG